MRTRRWGDYALGLASGAVLLVSIVLVGLVVGLAAQGVERAHFWGELFAEIVAIETPAVTLAWWLWQRRRTAARPPPSSDLVDALVTAVRGQWNRELQRLSLLKVTIPVRWSIADSGLANVQAQEAAKMAVSHDGVVHGVDHVVELFRALPTRPIMVLGDSGAGKTVLAMLFTLGLLSSREADEPVPVLLSASSWDPEEPLKPWIICRLREDYPELVDTYSSLAVEELVNKNRIMVVLDGLDEIPENLLSKAIEGLNLAVSGGYPMLVTCRGDAYEKVVRESGETLTQAVVLEIQPIGLDGAAAFLMAPERSSAKDRWVPVMDELRLQSDAPLAQVLASPLMVSLAVIVYAGLKHDPAELLGFRDRAAIEHYLLDAFIPAAYRNIHPEPGTSTHRPYSPDQARKWLTFLARSDLGYRQGDTSFAWWKLPGAAPRLLPGICVGAAAGLAGAGFPFPVQFGLGLVLVLAVGLLVRRVVPVRFDRTGLVPGFAGGIVGGLSSAGVALVVVGADAGGVRVAPSFSAGFACAIAIAPLARSTAGFVAAFVGGFFIVFSSYNAAIGPLIGEILGPVTHLVNGIGTGIVAWLAVGLAARDTPARELSWSRAGFIWGLACAPLAGFLLALLTFLWVVFHDR